MSEENGGENNQNDALTDLDDFEFYFRFIKPLVLELPTEEDRGIGAAWAQKLEQEPDTEEEKEQRLNYVKLLLFVLQRGRLSGIFKKQPPSGPLQPFPQGFSVLDMGNWMLDQDDAQIFGSGDAARVPYDIELSNDLREFAASQEIPNFGVQMYYAWSSEDPVNKWLLFDEEKFPQYILEKIKQLNESKSDDKTVVRNGCIVKKKGCDLTMPEKFSKKKVKSPQEIEKSQGRSYHTYLGLVGQMGNFSDKCDDDPEKYQRQEQRKGKCPKKGGGGSRFPGNAGEVEEIAGEEEYDNLVSGLGGLNAQNRPCLCPYPFQQYGSDHQGKGSQPFDPQTPFVLRGNTENIQNAGGRSAPKSFGRQCLERGSATRLPSMRNTPRQRSAPPNINVFCPPEDDPTQRPNQSGVCVCTNPPCTCPCPRRIESEQPRPNVASTAGGTCNEGTYDRASRPEAFGGRKDMDYGQAFSTTPDPCATMPSRSNFTTAPGYSTIPTRDSSFRNTEVLHCYDYQNPDPSLTKSINKNTQWVPFGQTYKYPDTNFRAAQERMNLIANAKANRTDLGSRRVLFEKQPSAQLPCIQSEQDQISPLPTDPLCSENSPLETVNADFQQQPPQNIQDCGSSVPQAAPHTVNRPTDEDCEKTVPDFQTTVDNIRKQRRMKPFRTSSLFSQPSQAPQVSPQQPQLSQAKAQSPRAAQMRSQLLPQTSRPAQVCPQQTQPTQVRPQQPQPTQVCPQQPQPTQVCPQQTRPTQVCPQQPQLTQVRPQQPQPTQVCPQQAQTAQMCPQQPQPTQVCPQQIQPTQVYPQQTQPTQVCPQQPQPTQVCPQQPQPTQVCPQQGQPTQVCPQQTQPTQVCPQQGQPTQVCPQQTQPTQVCPQQAQTAQMCPQQPRFPQMSPQQPQLSQMYPQQTQTAHVCTPQPQSSHVCTPQTQSSHICTPQPQSTQMYSQQLGPPQMYPQQLQSLQMCSSTHMWPQQAQFPPMYPHPLPPVQILPQTFQPAQMYKPMSLPNQIWSQQPRTAQIWPQQARPSQVLPQQSRPPRLVQEPPKEYQSQPPEECPQNFQFADESFEPLESSKTIIMNDFKGNCNAFQELFDQEKRNQGNNWIDVGAAQQSCNNSQSTSPESQYSQSSTQSSQSDQATSLICHPSQSSSPKSAQTTSESSQTAQSISQQCQSPPPSSRPTQCLHARSRSPQYAQASSQPLQCGQVISQQCQSPQASSQQSQPAQMPPYSQSGKALAQQQQECNYSAQWVQQPQRLSPRPGPSQQARQTSTNAESCEMDSDDPAYYVSLDASSDRKNVVYEQNVIGLKHISSTQRFEFTGKEPVNGAVIAQENTNQNYSSEWAYTQGFQQRTITNLPPQNVYAFQHPTGQNCQCPISSYGWPAMVEYVMYQPPPVYYYYPLNVVPVKQIENPEFIEKNLEANPYLEGSLYGLGNFQQRLDSTPLYFDHNPAMFTFGLPGDFD